MKKKPVAVFITDTHANNENELLILDIFRQYFTLVKKLGLKEGFHLGDFFTNRTGQKLDTLYLFKQISRLAVKFGITLYIIPGNHDKTDLSDYRSYLGIFDTYPNIKICDGQKPSRDVVYVGENIAIHLLPFFSDEVYYGKLADMKMKDGCFNVLGTHIGIEGVLDNDKNKVDSKVKTGAFKRFDLTLTGHYHDKQQAGRKVHYIGSAYQANYGEDEDKGFTILYSDLSLELIQSTFRKFKKLVIDSFDAEDLEEIIEKYSDLDDNVRFVFRGTEEDFLKIDKAVLTKKGIDVKWEEASKVISEEEVETSKASYTSADITQNFIRYCAENKIKGNRLKYGLQKIKENDFSR